LARQIVSDALIFHKLNARFRHPAKRKRRHPPWESLGFPLLDACAELPEAFGASLELVHATKDRPHAPEPPRLSHLLAVALELSMVVVFAANRSAVGLVLCAAYLWFSATLALFR
jgi:hypothetical protein